ncbi:hypothetical protein FRC03_002997 [Tulasnella sp. 419]|nr:hypothetical protein FRC03_002997 [Tulasnella sp. 419]
MANDASTSVPKEPQISPDDPVEELQRETAPISSVNKSGSESKNVPSQPAEDILSHPTYQQDVEERTTLLDKARVFLASPDIRGQDASKKRRFLFEKGLSLDEVDTLLVEMATPPPPVPPRTYPGAVQRTNWPELLASVTKAFTYLSGASAIVLLAYFKLILPRLSYVLDARHELQGQRLTELQRIQVQLEALKAVQKQRVGSESADNADKMGLKQAHEGLEDASPESKEAPAVLDDAKENLNLDQSLGRLATSLLAIREARDDQRESRSQTLESVSNLTGYISSQMHIQPLSFSSSSKPWTRPAPLGPVEEEVRREIRALKGLALNRRSFVPASSP